MRSHLPAHPRAIDVGMRIATCRVLRLALACVAGWLAAAEPVPSPVAKPLLGEARQVDGLTVRTFSLSGESIQSRPIRSVDGKALFVVEAGRLHRIAMPSGDETAQLELGSAGDPLGLCKEGLIVPLAGSGAFLVVDPASLRVIRRITATVPYQCVAMAAAPASNLCFSADRQGLSIIDAAQGKILRRMESDRLSPGPQTRLHQDSARGSNAISLVAITPDGRFLLGMSGQCLIRIRCEGLVVEELGPRIAQNPKRVELSEDGRYVALVCAGGNGQVSDHPQGGNYPTYIYAVQNLQSPVAVVSSGAYPQTMAFDPGARRIYGMNQEHQLLVFNAQGGPEGAHDPAPPGEATRAILPFPGGRSLVLLTKSSLLWVEFPGAPAGDGGTGGWLGSDAPASDGTLSRPGTSLLGEKAMAGTATIRPVALPAAAIVSMPIRSADGRTLHVLEASGKLHQIAMPAATESLLLDLGDPVGAFAMARDGLLIHLPMRQQLLVVDPATYKVKRRIPLPGCVALAAAPGSGIAYSSDRQSITAVELATGRTGKPIATTALVQAYGKLIKRPANTSGRLRDFLLPTLTPDGNWLLCQSDDHLHRFRCNGLELAYEEMGPRLGPGVRIVLSDDGRYLALPSHSGNVSQPDLPASGQSTYVFTAADLQRPLSVVGAGTYPRAFAFDQAAELLYASNYDCQLTVFTPQGATVGSHVLSERGDQTRFLLPFPEGRRILVVTEKSVLWVELPGASASGQTAAPTVPAGAPRIAGKPGEPLPARMARDAQGRSFVEMSSAGFPAELGPRVRDCVAAPSGDALYVIRAGQSSVAIIDPSTWMTVTEVAVPTPPCALWTDGEVVAAACPDSANVALIDPVKRRLVRSIGWAGRDGWRPAAVCGRAPDGGLATLWRTGINGTPHDALVTLGLDGSAVLVSERANASWCRGAWMPDGAAFFANRSFSAAPSGTGDLVTSDKDGANQLYGNTLFPGGGFHCNSGAVFTTHDRTALVFPRLGDDADGRLVRGTHLLPPKLDRVLLTVPGFVVSEVPASGIFVALDRDPPPGDLTALYLARDTGRVLRRISLQLAKPAARPTWMQTFRPYVGAIYLPGCELLLVPDQIEEGADRVYTAWRCGPPGGIEAAAPDAVASANDPPASGKPGQILRFVPTPPAAGGGARTYSLKRPTPGMAIDPATGAWTWTPTTEQAGVWQVTIIVTCDGKQSQVVSWRLTVE